MHHKPHRKTRRLLQYPRKDIVGNVYGRLTVISFYGYKENNSKRRTPYWLCKCVCGKIKSINYEKLKSGATSSCGCLCVDNMRLIRKKIVYTPRKQETKDKIRKTLLETYEKHPELLENRKPCGINQFNGNYSSLEKLISDVLKSMNIFFYHNQKVGKYYPDFLIFHNVIIECDGEYWHDEEKDKKRDSYLMDRGYYIFRLEGKRIMKDPVKCINGIVEILQFMQHETACKYDFSFKKAS